MNGVDDRDDDLPDEVEIPIDGTLDLHFFAPRDVPSLVRDYLDACRERGILAVRIVHGKGIGAQRETVRRALERHPGVVAFRAAEPDAGGWGATLVDLAPP